MLWCIPLYVISFYFWLGRSSEHAIPKYASLAYWLFWVKGTWKTGNIRKILTFLLFLKSRRWNSHMKDVLPLPRKVTFLSPRTKSWDQENSIQTDPVKIILLFVQPNIKKQGGFAISLGLPSLWRLPSHIKCLLSNIVFFSLLICLMSI